MISGLRRLGRNNGSLHRACGSVLPRTQSIRRATTVGESRKKAANRWGRRRGQGQKVHKEEHLYRRRKGRECQPGLVRLLSKRQRDCKVEKRACAVEAEEPQSVFWKERVRTEGVEHKSGIEWAEDPDE